MKFKNRVRKKLLINTINEYCIAPERRELRKIVLDILGCLSGVRFFGYRVVPMDPVQDFQLTNVDYLHKTKNKKDIYVNMSEDIVENIECYVLLDDDRVTAASLAVSKANTRRVLNALPKLAWKNTKLEEEIQTWDLSYMPTQDPRTQDNLLIKFNLYVPRLKNNVIVLNGNHYFNKYYIEEGAQITRAGKLKCQHPVYISYLEVDKSIEQFRLNIFKKNHNPFVFLEDLSLISDEYRAAILDDLPDDRKAYYNRVIDNTLEHAYNIDTSEMDTVDNVSEAIPSSDVLNYIALYIRAIETGVTSSTISLHTSLKARLLSDMKKSLKLGGKKKSKKQPPNELKGKINIDPRTVCTIIKNSNQYQLSKSANEVDIYHFFGYISNIEDTENVSTDRKFKMDQLGIIDPIGTSTSDNVGLAGVLVFSIPDEKIKMEEYGSDIYE